MALFTTKMTQRQWEELLISVSLTNLIFFPGWRILIFPNSHDYVTKYFPSYLDYLAIIALIAFWSGVLLLTVWLIRKLLNGYATYLIQIMFLFSVFCILNIFRVQFSEYEVLFVYYIGGRYAYLGLLFIIATVFVFLLVKRFNSVVNLGRTLILVLSPFFLITISQALVGVIDPGNHTLESSDISFSKTRHTGQNSKSQFRSRVLWIIFDELDYKIPFEKRLNGVELTAFDRIKSESLFATRAVSPARDTLESIPSLIIGEVVSKAVPYGKSELLLDLAGEEKAVKFSQRENIFHHVRQGGGETAIVGNYHSYCRVLRKDLSSCYWSGKNTFSTHFFEAVEKRMTEVAVSLPLGYRLFRFMENRNADSSIRVPVTDLDLVNEAKRAMSNPQVDLVMVHLPNPHPPYRYNDFLRKLGVTRSYTGNLILADQLLGKIREDLEEADVWDDATVVISSDHSWRVRNYAAILTDDEKRITSGIEDPRVPFILKLPGESKSIEYTKSFNTVVTSKLILSIMNGNVTNVEDASNWLDKNAK